MRVGEESQESRVGSGSGNDLIRFALSSNNASSLCSSMGSIGVVFTLLMRRARGLTSIPTV